MWGQGRRTDAYRGQASHLGENFSLLHQLLSPMRCGKRRASATSHPPRTCRHGSTGRSRSSASRGSRAAKYDRALAIVRDGHRVFSLLLVTAAPASTPIVPTTPCRSPTALWPASPIAAIAIRRLIPKFTLADGTELMATAHIKDVSAASAGVATASAYRQDEFDAPRRGLAAQGSTHPGQQRIRVRAGRDHSNRHLQRAATPVRSRQAHPGVRFVLRRPPRSPAPRSLRERHGARFRSRGFAHLPGREHRRQRRIQIDHRSHEDSRHL